MNQKSHLLQIFFFAIKNEFLLFKVNKQGKTNRLNVERLSLFYFAITKIFSEKISWSITLQDSILSGFININITTFCLFAITETIGEF